MIKTLLFVCGLCLSNQEYNSKYCFRIMNNQPEYYNCELVYDYTKK